MGSWRHPARHATSLEGSHSKSARPQATPFSRGGLTVMEQRRSAKHPGSSVRGGIAKAYPAESGYCFPLFPTSGPVGDRHRKPKAWSAILGGPGFDSSSAAFKSAARPTVAVT